MKHPLKRIAKALGTGLLLLVITLCLLVTILPSYLDRIYYRGAPTGHFNGEYFHNSDGEIEFPAPSGSRQGFIARWLLGSDDRPPWPKTVAVSPAKPAPFAAPKGMVATWVGHATVLVQAGGLNILTDPVWSDVVSPFPPIGPRRVAAPGIRFADLPKIDLILISHNHYDHLDLATLKRLWDRDHPAIVTSLGNDTILKAHGIGATALDWGKSVDGGTLSGNGPGWKIQCENYEHCPDYRVHVTRVHHWGSRWGTDKDRALWSGFFVETRAGNIYFSGDTGAGDMRWPTEAAKLGPIRLAILPIGAFRFAPGQMAAGAHIGPREAVEIFRKLGASTAIPIHWGTFRLSYEAYDTPPRMLDLFRRCAGIAAPRFRALRIGQSLAVPPYSAPVQGKPLTDSMQCRDGSVALRAMK